MRGGTRGTSSELGRNSPPAAETLSIGGDSPRGQFVLSFSLSLSHTHTLAATRATSVRAVIRRSYPRARRIRARVIDDSTRGRHNDSGGKGRVYCVKNSLADGFVAREGKGEFSWRSLPTIARPRKQRGKKEEKGKKKRQSGKISIMLEREMSVPFSDSS